jgi:hypothetical protein
MYGSDVKQNVRWKVRASRGGWNLVVDRTGVATEPLDILRTLHVKIVVRLPSRIARPTARPVTMWGVVLPVACSSASTGINDDIYHSG